WQARAEQDAAPIGRGADEASVPGGAPPSGVAPVPDDARPVLAEKPRQRAIARQTASMPANAAETAAQVDRSVRMSVSGG
ncbi:MAG TPA: hypothetical protein VGY53_10135, partial [Isosphaeraceae bacterium]|nr:hypothetical protein [Isosphaeraceae bacterium]